MFAVPKPVVVRQMLSNDEINKVYGKLKGLKKLKKHPRMLMEDLKQPLDILIFNLNSLIYFGHFQYNEEMSKYMKEGIEITKSIEDMIIRVVLRGENLEEVKAELKLQLPK